MATTIGTLVLSEREAYASAVAFVGAVYAVTSWAAKRGAAGGGGSSKGGGSAKGGAAAAPEARAAFFAFRRSYVVAFSCGLWCEYASASQLFGAVRETFPLVVIAELFAVSFGCAWACRSFLRRSLEAACGVRGACGVALVLYGASALCTAAACDDAGLYGVLVAGRACAGVAQPLLQLSFDAWMRSAHAERRFPSAWKRET